MRKVTIKKIYIIMFLVLLIFTMTYFFIKKNDGMEQTGIKNIYYKTYTNKWSGWSKNGIVSGNINSKSSIKNIEFKKSIFDDLDFSVNYYSKENGWSDVIRYDKKIKNQNLRAITIALDAKNIRKYDICYRTYNGSDHWLEWACNDQISGNKKENILAIEIKIIPKNIIKNEYLQGYDRTLNNSSFVGF